MSGVNQRTSVRLASIFAVSLLLAAATPGQDSPVADAAEHNDAQAVRALLQQGADANAPQPDGLTALHWAALNGNREIADLLLYAGATVKPLTRVGGYTPLHLAAQSGHADLVRALLEAGADPDVLTGTGVTAMHFAAQANSASSIAALAESGGDVDAQDGFQGRTPLVFAASRNATDAIRALLAAGADPAIETHLTDYTTRSEKDRDQQNLRQRVLEARAGEPEEERAGRGGGPPGRPGAQRQAAQRGAGAAPPDSTAQEPDPDEPEPNPDEPEPDPDEPAEEQQNEEKKNEEPPVRELSSIEQIGVQGGFAPLHYAARQGHVEAARMLLDAGADIDHTSGGDQSTPLLVAVINGNYDLAKELLERGADPNLVSDDGAGPLFATLNIEWSLRTWYPQPQMFRSQNTSYLDLMERLLVAGADPNQRTTTHIWYAAYNAGRMGVDFTGATPFWRAAYAADVKAMKLLVAYGADPNISTLKLPERRRFFGDPDEDEEEEEEDPSGLAPIPVGGPAVHPIHAAAGVGFGTSRVAQQHRSVPGGWLESMKYFVEELGLDPNLRDMDGYAPVHHAAARGDNETILYLVSKGADVTLIARSGQTTADMANSPEQRAQPHPHTVVLLEKLGSLNNHECRSCGEGR